MRFGLEDMYNNGPMEATITVHSTTLLVIRKQLSFNIKRLFLTFKISRLENKIHIEPDMKFMYMLLEVDS